MTVSEDVLVRSAYVLCVLLTEHRWSQRRGVYTQLWACERAGAGHTTARKLLPALMVDEFVSYFTGSGDRRKAAARIINVI